MPGQLAVPLLTAMLQMLLQASAVVLTHSLPELRLRDRVPKALRMPVLLPEMPTERPEPLLLRIPAGLLIPARPVRLPKLLPAVAPGIPVRLLQAETAERQLVRVMLLRLLTPLGTTAVQPGTAAGQTE